MPSTATLLASSFGGYGTRPAFAPRALTITAVDESTLILHMHPPDDASAGWKMKVPRHELLALLATLDPEEHPPEDAPTSDAD